MSLRGLGEEETAVVTEVYEPLRRFAGVVGPLEVDPDDLVQEAFLRVLRHGALSGLENPGAYLRRVVVNLAADHRRRLGRRRRALARLAASSPSGVDPVFPSDVADLLHLEPRARAVLFMHDVEGYSYQEIANLLGLSDSAARMVASRARRRLRAAFAEEV
ncbi:MAG: sigma-70 family RNA polymerase sigma factor [Acidimicrobiia bacterium]|nr:sigma-70 family RNA polymerase sigma factor [Acidimicrobiia bacterium]